MTYSLDKLIGVEPCKYCGGTSDRWFVEGFACKDCFELFHSLREIETKAELNSNNPT